MQGANFITIKQQGELWRRRQRRFAWLLSIPAVLFLLRVLAQGMQSRWPVPWLPDFPIWHSAAMPYSWLLASQILILLAMAYWLRRLFAGAVSCSPTAGRIMKIAGLVYFTLMLFRLLAGLTFLSHLHWFASTVPALFHLVLASFLMLSGSLHIHHKGDSI